MVRVHALQTGALISFASKLELLLAQLVKAIWFFTGIRGSFGCDVCRREKEDCSDQGERGGLVGEE